MTKQNEIIEVDAEEIHEETGLIIPEFDSTGLDKTDAQKTLDLFQTMFEELAKWEKLEREIKVKDENDFSAMQQAKQIRLAVRDIRTAGKRVHTIAKAPIITKGRYVDNINNTLDDLCTMIETRAKEKEDTLTRLMEEKRNRVKSERMLKLSEYQYNYQNLDLINMPDEVFNQTLEDAKILFAAKETIRENERLANEKKEREEKEAQEKLKLRADRLSVLNKAGLTTTEAVEEYTEEGFELLFNDLFRARIKENKLREQKIEKEKKEREQQDKIRMERTTQLTGIGFNLVMNKFIYQSDFEANENCIIQFEDVQKIDPKKWNDYLINLRVLISTIKQKDSDRRKEIQDNEDLRRERNAILRTYKAYGMPLHNTPLEKLSEEAWKDMLEKTKIESERLEAEEERQRKEGQSDLQNIIEYRDKLLAIELPPLSKKLLTAKLIGVQESIKTEIDKILKVIDSKK